jgi:hypothetical protein
MDDWAAKRIAELEARAPKKREKVEPYASTVNLRRAARAFTALGCSVGMLWLWLLHQTRKTGTKTVAVPNAALAKYGVKREAKRRGLRKLEEAGLISLELPPRKTPLATVL